MRADWRKQSTYALKRGNHVAKTKVAVEESSCNVRGFLSCGLRSLDHVVFFILL